MKKLLTLVTTLFIVNIAVSLDVNQQAPNFIATALLPDGSVKVIELKDYLGQKVVLYFYPMDQSPGCSKKAQVFRDEINNLKKHNIIVIGVSCDSIKSHKNFQHKYNIPYTLVSDSRLKRSLSKLYGASGFLYSQRKTVLIDERGKIVKIFTTMKIEEQLKEILNTFK